jgi:hypothetical protein
MSDSRSLVRASAAAILLAALAPAAPTAPAVCAAPGADPRPHCCYTHPRYAGVCAVEPQEDETCASILEYLNNPQSQGKAYCNTTNLRGGWKQAPCQPEMIED